MLLRVPYFDFFFFHFFLPHFFDGFPGGKKKMIRNNETHTNFICMSTVLMYGRIFNNLRYRSANINI